jgi:NAD(P)-dependent dehydrogenase (short-subunit alcohol dehydrogenase family)
MKIVKGRQAVVVEGSRGFGPGIVEALVEQQAIVTVVAPDRELLDNISNRFNVNVIQADVTEESVARRILRDLRPSILVLNASAPPPMSQFHELCWEDFSKIWEVDVKAGFHWLQGAIHLPLPRGSRVIIGLNGAALNGSPLSGSDAGAQRMLWYMAHYANAVAKELNLDIHFQTIAPSQIIGKTQLGRFATEDYVKRNGVSLDPYLAGFGTPMPPRKVGDNVVSILTDPRYQAGTAFGMKGDKGFFSLDA